MVLASIHWTFYSGAESSVNDEEINNKQHCFVIIARMGYRYNDLTGALINYVMTTNKRGKATYPNSCLQ